MKNITRLKIQVGYDLLTLKKAYAKYYGEKNIKRIRKRDVASWLASLAEADVQDFLPSNDLELALND